MLQFFKSILKSPQIIIFLSTYLNKVGNNKLKNIVNETLSMFGVLYIELKIMCLLFNINSIIILLHNVLVIKDSILNEIYLLTQIRTPPPLL